MNHLENADLLSSVISTKRSWRQRSYGRPCGEQDWEGFGLEKSR